MVSTAQCLSLHLSVTRRLQIRKVVCINIDELCRMALFDPAIPNLSTNRYYSYRDYYVKQIPYCIIASRSEDKFLFHVCSTSSTVEVKVDSAIFFPFFAFSTYPQPRCPHRFMIQNTKPVVYHSFLKSVIEPAADINLH